MELVKKFSEISDSITYIKKLKKKSLTNFYFQEPRCNELINKELLSYTIIGETLIILKKNIGFNNLYYYSSSINELENNLRDCLKKCNNKDLIIDIISKGKDNELMSSVEKSGFSKYTTLLRMNRISKDIEQSFEICEELRTASTHDAKKIFELLNNFFDPFADQLLTIEELLFFISKESIIVYESQNSILGFILYELIGVTLYLRYWFVHPEFRENKIGSKLFKFFLFKGKNSQRQLFWVNSSNQNAIKRYKHYGFVEEKLFNFVLKNHSKIMRDKLIKILSEIRPEFDFSMDYNFIEQGMLDSFDVISLVNTLDEEFGISIDGTDIIPENFATLNSISNIVSKYIV